MTTNIAIYGGDPITIFQNFVIYLVVVTIFMSSAACHVVLLEKSLTSVTSSFYQELSLLITHTLYIPVIFKGYYVLLF